jgi:HK97 family phage major capsid protein
MSKELETKLQQLGEAVEAFKGVTNRIDALEKKAGHAPADFKEMQDKTNDAISSIQAELKEVKAAAARGNVDPKQEKEIKNEMERKAMEKFLRKGAQTLNAEELKALSVDSDQDGGFLVTPQLSSEIVTKQFETSPMRSLASVMSISGSALEIIQDLDEADAEEVGEIQSRSNTGTPQLKKIVISAHEMYAKPLATQTMLEDAAVNVESWLAAKVADKFARKENTNYIVGNGVGKAKGILAYDAGTGFNQLEQVETAAATTLAASDVMDLLYSLKKVYRSNAAILAARSTIAALRKLKDSQNRFLWEPGLNGDQQEKILGKRLEEFADMQEGVTTAGKLVLAIGDFKQGYQIVDRIGISVIRDIYSQKPYIEFYTRKRSGGGVKNFEAIKLLKIKA